MTLALMKLGKLAPKRMMGLPMISTYTKHLPAPPPVVDYGSVARTDAMFLNDQLGCCTVSAIGHCLEIWSATAESAEVTLSDSVISSVYSAVSGYNGDPQTDNGAACADVLRYWYENPIDGHVLKAFAAVRPGVHDDIKNAVYRFGCCYIGIQLPLTAQDQNGTWDVIGGGNLTGNAAPGSWGGHCVEINAYHDNLGLTCRTWGMEKKMTWAFWDSYCDEAFALLSADWIEADGRSPQEINLNELISDMAELKK